MNHDFCRQELLEVRHEAAQAGITIPKKMTAIRSTDRLFFVQGGDGDAGDYVKGDCSWSAKARRIRNLIDAKPEITNNSGMTQDEVSKLTKIGVCRNNWRQRLVTVYEIPESTDDVISVGESFDGKRVVICREPRNGFSNAIAMFPKTYIYN